MAIAAVRVKVIEEAMPFGDVPLAPREATGRSEAEWARAIVQGLIKSAPQPAEGVAPLTARLGVGALMRRSSRAGADDERKRAA